MIQSSNAVGELARQLVQHEAGGSSDPALATAAVEAVCRRLRDDLTDVLGSGGLTALLGRALNLAKREHPRLKDVSSNSDSTACFAGLADALRVGTGEEASAAAAAIVAHLLGLLVTLLGEELGMQPIRKIWPDVVPGPTEIDE